jgi:hypothetical protein
VRIVPRPTRRGRTTSRRRGLLVVEDVLLRAAVVVAGGDALVGAPAGPDGARELRLHGFGCRPLRVPHDRLHPHEVVRQLHQQVRTYFGHCDHEHPVPRTAQVIEQGAPDQGAEVVVEMDLGSGLTNLIPVQALVLPLGRRMSVVPRGMDSVTPAPEPASIPMESRAMGIDDDVAPLLPRSGHDRNSPTGLCPKQPPTPWHL